MIRHIVAWKLVSEDAAERAAQTQRISEELRALEGVIPSLKAISVGPDALGGANWDIALVADFDDLAGLDAYQVHPAHQAIVGFVRSVVSERAAVDFEF